MQSPPYQISSMRTINSSSKKFKPELSEQELIDGCRLGMDSHADVSCVGKHAHILERFTGRTCNVQPFNDSYESIKNVCTVNAAFAYDDAEGKTYIIEVNQSLDFTQSMEHSLLCPNQARVHGVIVDDVPTFLDATGRSTHSIRIPESSIDLPLSMHGTISYLPVRYPTQEEIDEYEHIELTDSQAEWDPHCLDGLHKTMSSVFVHSSCDISLFSSGDELLYPSLYENLCHSVMISSLNHRKISDITPEHLATMWKIPLHHARLTLKATTHSSVQLNEGMLSRRFKTKVHHTRYRQLGGYLGMFASDTFTSNVASIRGNKYTQLFCNRANFC